MIERVGAINSNTPSFLKVKCRSEFRVETWTKKEESY